jgi:hypothetical protein
MSVQIVSILGSLFACLFILELVRRRQLQVRYSLLWLASSLVLLLFSVWRGLLEIVAGALGVFYAPSVLLLFIIVLGFFLFVHFSVIVSELSRRVTTLTQELTLMEREIERLQSGADQATGGESV